MIIELIEKKKRGEALSAPKIHAMIQANAAKKGNGKKSKFQQRYEEIMRQQEQMMKQQNAQKGKRK